jgi:uncharacterized protein YdeI (BOF family)
MIARMKHALVIITAFIAFTASAFAAEPSAPKAVKPLTVDELAANPAAHSGHVSVVGVVGTVNPGKGFVLVDNKEFKNCGLSCLTEPGTNKIPFLWSGATPQVKQTVQVDGILEKTAKGFSIKAEKVTTQ